MKHILIYFDTNPRPSLFDILFAYDVGFDDVQSLGGVTADEIVALVQDCMFPRGPKGAQYSTLYFGGDDLDLVEKLAKKAQKTMFPPFNLSIAVDPKGAYTTSSAIVGKMMEGLRVKGQTLEGKKAAVLGGCGRVGRVTARILAKEGVEVTLVDVIDRVGEVATKTAEMTEGVVSGVKAVSPDEVVAAARDVDLIVSAGPAGVELLPAEHLAQLENCLVVADVNAVPPAGIGGVKAKYDKREVNGVLAIGALAVGDLRNKVARLMFRTAMESEGAFLDYTNATEFAKQKADL
jgi:methylene-tetrahydromethanopterin dehydrogenase